MMRTLGLVVVLASGLTPGVVEGQNYDLFNYYSSDRNENGITSRGQSNWDQVRCGNDEICVRSKEFHCLILRATTRRAQRQSDVLLVFTFLLETSDWFPQQIPRSTAKFLVLSVGTGFHG